MQSFYYSAIGVLAIVVHVIINYEMFSKPKGQDRVTEQYFHVYLLTVLLYYITDALWGIFDYFGKTKFLYIDTVAYYIAMGLSVIFCCRYIISFLDLNKILKGILNAFGPLFFLAEIAALIINAFTPIFFYFDAEGIYHAETFRHIALFVQIIMYAGITLISLIVAIKGKGNSTKRNITIFIFGSVMTAAICLQGHFPLLPLYSLGLMIGTSVLHVFIQEDTKNEQYEVLNSLAEIFYSMHVIDLVNDTVDIFNSKNEVKQIVNHRHGASEMMKQVITTVTSKDYLEQVLEFTDLSTVAERMKNKKLIFKEFVGNRLGWVSCSFITMEADEEGRPTKVIFSTRVIDKEKRKEEFLIRTSHTDEMTGVFNRRAYEKDIYEHNDIPEEKDFIYVSIDVNGLKVINDTKGHLAGDELIIGATQCMTETLGQHGKIYRIGGDEFVAILFVTPEEVSKILTDFDNSLLNWKGKLIETISVSYGWISKEEKPEASVRQLGAIAEKRMYEAKSAHYRKQGVDRRGQQDAHKALCELYTKILKVNLTEDSYQIVNMDESEKTEEKGFAQKISEWLSSFGKTGQVHPDDLEEYLRLTDINYIKNYFASNKTSLHIFYRRKCEDCFKQVMMEIIPASDYKDDNQSLFLYVKDIDG